MNFLLITLIFSIWRGLDFLIILFSQKIIPYLGFFPYANQLSLYHLPTWVSALANFDGLHYISIARNGYAQYEQAFFPLYPILIKFLSPLFSGNQLLTGLVISNISFLIGLIIFYKYLNEGVMNHAPTTIFLLLAFPTSFFFGAVYTEGFFFLLLILTLYFLKKKNYLLVFVFAFLASLTRLVGVFLIIPIFFHLIQRMDPRRSLSSTPIGDGDDNSGTMKQWNNDFILNTKYLILVVSPLIGLGLYCFYLWKTTGDPLFFLTSQPIFGANRSSHLILLPQVYWRYLKIFFTAAHDSRFYVAIVEFLIFNFVFIVLVLDLFKNLGIKNSSFWGGEKRRLQNRFWTQLRQGFDGQASQNDNIEKISLNLFSFANLLLPTLTGTFSSIPRYSLFSLSFFIYLAHIKNNFLKYLILLIFLFLHILLLGYFTQGYFIS